MTTPNSDVLPFTYEVDYETSDGLASGKFLMTIYAASAPSSSLAPSNPTLYSGLFLPALEKLQTMHGDVPFNIAVQRVYVSSGSYSTTPP